MSIEHLKSAPDYIHKFVESNIEDLNKIYSKESVDTGEGILYCKCSMEDNKLELIYMIKQTFIEVYSEEIWNGLQTNKRIIFIQDLDINENFALYF
jgi:hypothetical protein